MAPQPETPISREDVEQLAQREGLTAIDLITQLQGGAASLGDEGLLEQLCTLKNTFIGII